MNTRLLTIIANVLKPQSTWRQSFSFKINYTNETTINDLKYHLLAHTRDNLPAEEKKFYKDISDIGLLSDPLNKEKYSDEMTLEKIIVSNSAARLAPFVETLFNQSKETRLNINNHPAFKELAIDNVKSLQQKK